MKIATLFLLLTTFSCIAFADDPDSLSSPSHYITGFAGRSIQIFGSEDGRFGGGLSYAYGQPEPRFSTGQIKAQLVYEGYIDHTESNGGSGFSRNATFGFGGLSYGRWRWPMDQYGNGVYFDLGLGLQLATQPTLDLESVLNSTPVMDFGGVFRDGHNEYLIGFRFLHISNAGTVRPNYGQNELFFTLGFRY